MAWRIEGSRVIYEDRPVASFQYPVSDLAELDNMAVIILDVPPGVAMTENVFCVSRDGARLWQIEWTPQTGTNPLNLYVGVTAAEPEKGLVHVANSNGDVVDVDMRTGKIMGHHFLK